VFVLTTCTDSMSNSLPDAFFVNFSKDLQILTTSRHLVHLNLQIALGLTQIVFLAGGSATQEEV
jgi:hypothetical protein